MFVTKERNSLKETQILKEDKIAGLALKYLRNYLLFTFAPVRLATATRCYVIRVQTMESLLQGNERAGNLTGGKKKHRRQTFLNQEQPLAGRRTE